MCGGGGDDEEHEEEERPISGAEERGHADEADEADVCAPSWQEMGGLNERRHHAKRNKIWGG